MKKCNFHIALLLPLILLLGSCDVFDLVLVNKKIPLLTELESDLEVEITGTSFNETLNFQLGSQITELDLPGGHSIEEIQIRSIRIKALSKEGNISRQLNWSASVIDLQTNEEFYWAENISSIISDESVEPNYVIVDGKNLEGIRKMNDIFSRELIQNGENDLKMRFHSSEPDQEFLNVSVTLLFDFEITGNYCGSIPGNSELEDCE